MERKTMMLDETIISELAKRFHCEFRKVFGHPQSKSEFAQQVGYLIAACKTTEDIARDVLKEHGVTKMELKFVEDGGALQ